MQPTGNRPLAVVYIGIDLHRKRSQVAALDGNGELPFNRRAATRAAELFKASKTPARSRSKWSSRLPSAGAGWRTCSPEAGILTDMGHPLATKASFEEHGSIVAYVRQQGTEGTCLSERPDSPSRPSPGSRH